MSVISNNQCHGSGSGKKADPDLKTYLKYYFKILILFPDPVKNWDRIHNTATNGGITLSTM